MATVNRESKSPVVSTSKRGRPARPPSRRNCAIYERIRLDGENLESVAADYAVSRQCVAYIVARVESWIAAHSAHPLAQKMRVRCGRRWETLWSWAIEAFDRSRQNREVKKERTARSATGQTETIITEQTIREQNGDPRYLHIAWRVAQREDRLWLPPEMAGPTARKRNAALAEGATMMPIEPDGQLATSLGVSAASSRFEYLPSGLLDLEHLACGLRNGTESVPYRGQTGTESVPYRGQTGAESVPDRGQNGTEAVLDRERNGAGAIAKLDATPVSTLFERRCAEAFRCLGFEVRELGQGCGRTADCLAVAPAERFAVIIDAKVRRRGYTLGTDDRQFCEYATRHSRELAQSGIERVYFAVVGRGFRQADLDKLAGFMTGTPIRSVVFVEAAALMRLVDESIRRRREFRLAEIDQLLFGNKILGE